MLIAEFLLGAIALGISFYAEKYRQDDFSTTVKELENDSALPVPKTYDFIIVGAGTAGCLLAGRLSEKFNVLLLEAGGTPPPAADVPFFAVDVARDPDINYFFNTVDMPYGGVARMHTGKMLGGSGSHNDLVHNRGSPKDYDNFARILEDPSWAYENVVEYFRRSETFLGKQYGDEDNSRYYGTSGPIQVISEDRHLLLPTWFEAAGELGYSVGDPNGFQTESFTPVNTPLRNGRRSSTYAEFVKPYEESRATLTVVRYANVSEILVNENKAAYGVAYTRHGFPQMTYASKEVILSAGFFSSPLLLMKSGIGPVDQLNAAEIPVKVPLPAVGKNVSEHAAMLIGPFYVNNNDTSLFHHVFRPEDTEKVVEEYQRGEGPLAIEAEGPQALKVSARAARDWPNLSVTVHPLAIRRPEDRPTVMFYVVLGRPQSKGYVNLNATAYKLGIRDDVQLAEVDFHFLDHPDDIEDLVEGIQFAFQITRTAAFQRDMNLTYTRDPSPGCTGFPSDDYWRCHIRNEVAAWIHMVGSARLGPANGNADTSVLDNKFRVRGMTGLRVVDASVMPEVPNTNLNAPVMMIAEKAVDDILADWEGTITTTTTVPTTTTTVPTTTNTFPTTTTTRATTASTTQNTNGGVTVGTSKWYAVFIAFAIFIAGPRN